MFTKSILAGALFALLSGPAFAWGTVGHKIINLTAVQALPATVPAFVRTPDAALEIEALGPELDRSKGAGRSHDNDDDPGHYLNIDDNLMIGGVVALNNLPPNREKYDDALRAKNSSQYELGFLPYNIIDGWEQVRKDFAYWRADSYLAEHSAKSEERAWFFEDQKLREMLTLRDIGIWGHYVGDGSQPLHVTIHYNGWGKGPNPNNYSTDYHVHSTFESALVDAHATVDNVRLLIGADAITDPGTGTVISQIEQYLAGSAGAVVPIYTMIKAGELPNGKDASPQMIDLMQHRLAAGAQELRDLIVAAWDGSADETVSYPEIKVQDILSGKVLPPPKAFGSD